MVDASFVGHDLSRGTAVFAKAVRPERAEAEDDTDPMMKEILHGSVDLPQLDSTGQRRTVGNSAATSHVA